MSERLADLALQHAKRLAETGAYEKALEVIENIGEPPLGAAARLRLLQHACNEALLTQLQQTFPDNRARLAPTCSSQDLPQYPLRAAEAYVWTLCDGRTTIDEVILLAGNGEVGTLLTLRKLVSLGLLAEPRS